MKKEDKTIESFICVSCQHDLQMSYCLRTFGYCYLCDPNITVEELLSDEPIEFKTN